MSYNVLFHFLSAWSILIVIVSILAQWVSLYLMHCFRRMPPLRESKSH